MLEAIRRLARERGSRLRRSTKSRSRRSSSASSTSSTSGRDAAIAPAQKLRPITDARCSTVFDSRRQAGRCARRSAPGACPGSAPAARSSPHSATHPHRPPRGRAGCPRSSRAAPRGVLADEVVVRRESASTSCSLSAAPSGSSSIEVARTRPPPQFGRTSSSSGRARQRISSGRRAPSRSGARSARAAAPRPSGCPRRRARAAGSAPCSWAHSRAAQAISCWLRSPWTASSTPVARPSRSATASAGQHSRSFSIATSSGSSSAMSAAPLTISASGQYVMLSPYGRQRPLRTVAPSSESRNSLREPALADAGLAVDREEVRAPVARRRGRRCSRAARARGRGR